MKSFLGPIFVIGGLLTALAICLSMISLLTAPRAPKYTQYEFTSVVPEKAEDERGRSRTTAEGVFDGLTETGQKAVFLLAGGTKVYCRLDERQRVFLGNVGRGAKVKVTYQPRAQTGGLVPDQELVSVKVLGKRP